MASLQKIVQSGLDQNTVFAEELEVIRAGRKKLEDNNPAGANPANLLGLALSGGGIRSATFNLGILQALAGHRLLPRIDYLSTVSGGGYIGAWLSALIYRTTGGSPASGDFRTIQDRIGCGNRSAAPATEDQAIQRLRSYSNYLTPNNSPFSLDWLAAVANLFRNLVLNQLVLVCLLATLLLLPSLLADSIVPALGGRPWSLGIAAGISALCFLVAAFHIARGLWHVDGAKPARHNGAWVFTRIVLPSFLGSALLAWVILQIPPAAYASGSWAWIAMSYYAALWAGSLAAVDWRKTPGNVKAFWVNLPATLIAGAAIGFMLYAYAQLLAVPAIPVAQRPWLSLGLGTALVFEILCLGMVLHIGLAKRYFSEFGREWLARAGGQANAIQLAWAALCLAAFYGPALFLYLNRYIEISGGFAWLATTLAGLWLAKSDKTGKKHSSPWAEAAAHVAPYVFIAGLVLLISASLHWGMMRYAGVPFAPEARQVVKLSGKMDIANTESGTSEWTFAAQAPLSPHFRDYATRVHGERQHALQQDRYLEFEALAAFALLTLLLAWRVDVNLFSMQQFYRNRLTRSYLGASNDARQPDRFTGFAKDDDLPLSCLETQRPIHLVNTALNLTRIGDEGTRNEGAGRLDWQQRMSASFTFSPLFCGFSFPDNSIQAYRRTREYMSSEGWGKKHEGPQLGMAVAVSGAAANPNMGYHTSLVTSFLMTFFNVRLGRWCGNPRNPNSFQSATPPFGLWYLLRELLGTTDASTRYVNLSDGGHFENLGLYELVRRRCRLIVASDASCDPLYQFEDLGNAIRKCRVDLGAEIEIDVSGFMKKSRKQRMAIGTIRYAQGGQGVLVYIKPWSGGRNEPVDVSNYAATHRTFPHETTSDQWFDEAQFECYRQLGLLTGEDVFGTLAALAAESEPTDAWIAQVAAGLESMRQEQARERGTPGR